MARMLADDAGFARWWFRRHPAHVGFFRRETMAWIARRFGWQATFPTERCAVPQTRPGAPCLRGTVPEIYVDADGCP